MNNSNKKPAVLLLEDGTIFHGKLIHQGKRSTGEICFNTGTTGYQEIFTDPSYYGQIMVTTNAHIGNYGVTQVDSESSTVKIAALVCKNFSENHSRPAATSDLLTHLKSEDLTILSDVDTRALVRHIRKSGAQNAIISADVDQLNQLQEQLAGMPSMKGLELASKVSCTTPYTVGDPDASIRVAALDLGIKQNILNNLTSRDIYVKVFPFNTSFKEMQDFKPDGYFISNGPGDPAPLEEAVKTARQIIEANKPLFGICLGHQIIAQANDIETFKMHNGHRGINHPVKNLTNSKGEITSQNHGFAINKEQAVAHTSIEITHTHLNDDTVAGIKMVDKPCFSVQYHPEAGPGPNDATYLFDQFVDLIKEHKN